MIKITLPANADLSIFDDVLRRPELIQALKDCGCADDLVLDDLVVEVIEPIDLLAIVAEHIRETNIVPAGGVFESLDSTTTRNWRNSRHGDRLSDEARCVRIKVCNRGLIKMSDDGNVALLIPSQDHFKTHSNDIFNLKTVARPEDPKFFDVIDDFCRGIMKGWGRLKC